MKQRALEAGTLSDPYRFVERGEEFDDPEAKSWAEVIEPEPEAKPAKGSKAKAEPAADVI